MSILSRMWLIAAACAAAALFAVTMPEQADAQGTAAATAASTCGHQAAFSHRSLNSVKTANHTLHALCAKRHSKLTTVSFLQSQKHNWMIAPRFKKCWQVPNQKWRHTVCRARQLLRVNLVELDNLSHRIAAVSAKLIYQYDGYTAPDDARLLGEAMAAKYGWTEANGEWQCLDQLWGIKDGQILESGWNMLADNPISDAFGIPQALPGSKMGPRWKTSAWAQIRWGLSYVLSNYHTPCNALHVRLAQGSY